MSGEYVYYGAMTHNGFFRIPTALLNNPQTEPEVLAVAIERIGDKPLSDGLSIDLEGNFSHIYPDGVAPYFTFSAMGTSDGNMQTALDKWCLIKLAANEAVTRLGGTVTHHHAVGRDHHTGYEAQTSPLFRDALVGAKQRLDPTGHSQSRCPN